MIIPHIDFRKAFKGEDLSIFCTECGDCYLVEFGDSDFILQCRNCNHIKIEDERN